MKRQQVQFLIVILISVIMASCQLFESKSDARVVARVHDAFLYEDQLKDFNIPLGLTEKDSVALLTEYIDDWATKQLLLYESKQNMTQKKQAKYDKFVEDYKIDLFVSDYENGYVQKKLNTVISDLEIDQYYQKHQQSFLLKEDLVKVRYIHLPLSYTNTSATKKLFTRFKVEDQIELKKIQLGFKKVDLNLENSWSTFDELLTAVPSISNFKKSSLLIPNKFFQYKDTNGKYLMKFEDVLLIGQPAPVTYVKETIKQIILNKRKLQLKKQLEKEIVKDALQTKDYTIFE